MILDTIKDRHAHLPEAVPKIIETILFDRETRKASVQWEKKRRSTRRKFSIAIDLPDTKF